MYGCIRTNSYCDDDACAHRRRRARAVDVAARAMPRPRRVLTATAGHLTGSPTHVHCDRRRRPLVPAAMPAAMAPAAAASELSLPVHTPVPRFGGADLRAAAGYLREHGYVVVAGALTPSEITRGLSLVWELLEGLGSGIARRDPRTWDNTRWPDSGQNGILAAHGCNHSAAAWHVRGAPGVKRVFAELNGTDDLLCSFDNICLFRPWRRHPERRTQGDWYQCVPRGRAAAS
eukprot:SAG22_NODE_3139_length_1908_cov_1.787175_1_plen_232_part_00